MSSSEFAGGTGGDGGEQVTGAMGAADEVGAHAGRPADAAAADDAEASYWDARPLGQQILWEGDTGTLPLEVRRLLVRLVKGPYLSARDDATSWATLQAHLVEVRRQLSELFLELVMDEDLKVAFARTVTTSEFDAPVLMRSHKLSHLATMLLVYLRHLHLRAHSVGEAAYIDYDEIRNHLLPFVHFDGVQDERAANKRINGAITSLKNDYAILRQMGSTERYQISDIVAILVDANFAAALEQQYAELLRVAGDTSTCQHHGEE